MLSLNLLATQAHRSDLADQARRARVNATATPVTRVTLRYAAAADAPRLRDLAELDSALLPDGPVLLAEVDGRLRAALPIDGGAPISDPFHRGRELLQLLQLRADQLRPGGAGA
ncbi:MAG TPA: hypothetical protein VIM18_13285 [Solirubrobacteraceae bacterium]